MPENCASAIAFENGGKDVARLVFGRGKPKAQAFKIADEKRLYDGDYGRFVGHFPRFPQGFVQRDFARRRVGQRKNGLVVFAGRVQRLFEKIELRERGERRDFGEDTRIIPSAVGVKTKFSVGMAFGEHGQHFFAKAQFIGKRSEADFYFKHAKTVAEFPFDLLKQFFGKRVGRAGEQACNFFVGRLRCAEVFRLVEQKKRGGDCVARAGKFGERQNRVRLCRGQCVPEPIQCGFGGVEAFAIKAGPGRDFSASATPLLVGQANANAFPNGKSAPGSFHGNAKREGVAGIGERVTAFHRGEILRPEGVAGKFFYARGIGRFLGFHFPGKKVFISPYIMRTPTPSVYVRGMGVYTPERRLTNDDLTRLVDTSDEWIRTRTGIIERRLADADESASDMAAKAAENAIANANISKEEIDLIIVATATPDHSFPSTACRTQAKLGLKDIPAFDMSAACSGFIYMMQIANHMLRAGDYRNVLIISTEKLSSIVDWEDRNTCVLFGDAAAAFVLTKCNEPYVGILGNILGADGASGDLLSLPAGGSASPASYETVRNGDHYLHMAGQEVFKVAVRTMSDCCKRLLEKCNVSADEIKCVIPHQANLRIIDAVARQLGIPLERFCVNLQNYGNTSSATIPNCMKEAYEAGRFKAGDLVLLTAFGGGFTWGATLIRWK